MLTDNTYIYGEVVGNIYLYLLYFVYTLCYLYTP